MVVADRTPTIPMWGQVVLQQAWASSKLQVEIWATLVVCVREREKMRLIEEKHEHLCQSSISVVTCR